MPLHIQHRAGAVHLSIYPEGMAPRPEPDTHLIDLLTVANVWFRKLTRGHVESIKQLADEENVSVPYATRIVYLALLSPRIVQTILEGSDSLVPSKRRLLAMLPLALSWKEQDRQVLRAT